jgi:hypothetical protein
VAEKNFTTYVLESTISRNSWLVGTAGMSFHWVFILAGTTSVSLCVVVLVAHKKFDCRSSLSIPDFSKIFSVLAFFV